MIEKDFYLTLLSNSSMSYFPENKTSSFITQLPRRLYLDGEWSVGLVEIQYPCTLLNVGASENKIYLSFKTADAIRVDMIPNDFMRTNAEGYVVRTEIPSGFYSSIKHLLKSINDVVKGYIELVFNTEELRTEINFKYENLKSIRFSKTLSVQLGFEPGQPITKNSSTSEYQPHIILGLPSQMFVYMDIIENQLIGDVTTKVLRNISLDNSDYVYGSRKMLTFSAPHYVKVLNRNFDCISIDLRTETGQLIPFEFGTLCLKVHFKKIE